MIPLLEVEMNYYMVNLTTEGGVIYDYGPLEASSAHDAVSIVCANWQGQLPCTAADLRQVGERQWEITDPGGLLIQVWEDQERVTSEALAEE